MDTPAPETLGESLAHVSRCQRWTSAVFFQICLPVGYTLLMVHVFRSDYSPAFFSSVPWRLPLLLSWSAYGSVFFMMISYAELFLPRTPMAVVDNINFVAGLGVGLCVIGFMVTFVLSTEVEDSRVLAGCFSVVAAFIAGLVACWVWLARTYGDHSDALESPAPDADESSKSCSIC